MAEKIIEVSRLIKLDSKRQQETKMAEFKMCRTASL